jgi:hypothetical protein
MAMVRGCQVVDQRDARRRCHVLWIHTGGLRVRVAWDHGDGRPEVQDIDVDQRQYAVVVPLHIVATLGLE